MNGLTVISKLLNKRSLVLLSIPTIGYKYWSQTKVQSTKPLVTRLGVQRVRNLSLRRAHLNGHKSIDEIINETRKSFVKIQNYTINAKNTHQPLSDGSGVFIDLDGYILTNSHVIEESTALVIMPFIEFRADSVDYVKNYGSSYWLGSLVYTEPNLDLALIRTLKVPSDVSVVTFSDDVLEVGEDVIALGNPDIDYSVCEGIIANIQRKPKTWSMGTTMYYKNLVDANYGFIAGTAKISTGYSGGPLINSKGQVVAVNFAGTDNIYEGYSTSTAEAKEFIKRALDFPKKDRENRYSLKETNGLGIAVKNFTHNVRNDIQLMPGMADFAYHLDDNDQGVLVCCHLTPFSNSKDIIQKFDIIVKVNVSDINVVNDLKKAIKQTNSNELKVKVWRHSRLEDLTIRPQTIDCGVI